MKTKRLAPTGIALVLMVMVVAACAPAKTESPCPTSASLSCPTAAAAQVPTNPTLTFDVALNQCTYNGPKTLPYGKFTLDVVAGQIPDGHDIGFAIGTLKEGKTLVDLNNYPTVDPPAWVTVLDAIGPFAKNISYTYNLSSMGIYTKGEPIYLVCFSGHNDLPDQPLKIATIGPIEVQE